MMARQRKRPYVVLVDGPEGMVKLSMPIAAYDAKLHRKLFRRASSVIPSLFCTAKPTPPTGEPT